MPIRRKAKNPVSYSLHFNNTGTVTVTNPTAVQLTGNMSLACWVMPKNGNPSFWRIISKEDGSNLGPYGFITDTTGKLVIFQIRVGGTAHSTGNSVTSLTPGRW